jgi:hypothetical protein
MNEQHAASPALVETLRRLCEYELPQGNEILCHDGGFRYGGDFESLELTPLNAPQLVAGEHYPTLLRLGYIEETVDGFRVTERGRALAYATER